MSEMMMTKTMTNSPQESTESDSSSEKIMSEMMMMTRMRTMSYSPQESTESESDSSRRDSTTSSSSDLSDGSHDSSGSPPLKKPRLATVFEPLFDDEYEAMFMSLMDFDDEEPKVVKYGPREDETFAKLVLAYYKDTKGEDYELSKIRSMMPFPPREQVIFQDGSRQESSDGGTHLNFFARPRGCNEPEYLFYGELLHRPIDPQVVDCFKFPLGTHIGVDLILHPPYIVCPDCDYLGRYELNDDDYEYK